MNRVILLIAFAGFCLTSCVQNVSVDKYVYAPGEVFELLPGAVTSDATIELRNMSERGEPLVAVLGEGETSWKIPDDAPFNAVSVWKRDKNSEPEYLSYFRVAGEGQLLTYEILRSEHKGLPVFALDGGMSAEYAVQKSLSNLCAGVSHTWGIGAGGGPSPVWGAPDFLERSILQTVSLYDEALGEDAPIETVVIGTGVPSVPYLTGAMRAAFLPSHFLVSVNSVREVSTIVSHGTATGYPCYATLGYDASMADVGVAWIKLLDIPEEYLDFIDRHMVKNVVILGIGENVAGESLCRRVKGTGCADELYLPGSVYIQYTNYGSEQDMESISNYLKDYDEDLLDEGAILADWESGLVNRQTESFASTVERCTKASAWLLSAPEDMIDMYNFAVRLSLAFMSKNGIVLKGVNLNEYLISQPVDEMSKGMVPLLYWQFNTPSSTVDRLDEYVVPAAASYYPDRDMKQLHIHVNARIGKKEIFAELLSRGYANVTKRLDNVEEVWDLSDGINAPCEFAAESMLFNSDFSRYKKGVEKLKYLEIDDIQILCSSYPGEKGEGVLFENCGDQNRMR